jgi:FtsP/CotA-like multicopper oxidase with cupredoxin domain
MFWRDFVMQNLSRRQFLASTAAAGLIGLAPGLLVPGKAALAAPPVTIRIGTRVIEVNGRPASVFGLTQPDGSHGLTTEAGQRFRVRLESEIDEETLIHWHGLTPPWQQDGVPDLSQPALKPGASYDYDFALDRPGTNWMHSHHGLQEQRLMAAPLIVRDPAEAGADMQDVVVLFHDFTFRDPDEILTDLQGGGHGSGGHGAAGNGHGMIRRMVEAVMPAGTMDHGAGHGAMTHGTMGANEVHLHDVDYDAFLANDRTLDDPEVFRVERGGRVRLRLINAATATNFWIDLDRLEGRLIAVDGMPVEPLPGRRFEFAIAQRLDIVLELPTGDGAWPIFAVREGEQARTGFVLATPDGMISKVAGEADEPAAPVGLGLERRLRASQPLPARPADRHHTLTITEAPGYTWMLNGAVHGGHEPLDVGQGERVEITFVDQTTMAHPMHLHGHHFQVVAIDGQRFSGAVRDTVLVPAKGSVTIAFDAGNPGKWALHCHHLYHMAAGMMTNVVYES